MREPWWYPGFDEIRHLRQRYPPEWSHCNGDNTADHGVSPTSQVGVSQQTVAALSQDSPHNDFQPAANMSDVRSAKRPEPDFFQLPSADMVKGLERKKEEIEAFTQELKQKSVEYEHYKKVLALRQENDAITRP